jgi:2,3-diketo-5-methylthio-1-phosphopentane phosphatase
VTIALGERGIRGVVLDIEGTTTPISFVYEVLFPYARAHLRDYLRANRGTSTVARAIQLLNEEWEAGSRGGGSSLPSGDSGPGTEIESVGAYLERLMDQDVKSPGLKLIQGEIWKVGYDAKVLRGDVFPDVPPALERWHSAGIDIAIYSSGSVLAQRLIFGSTPFGDLTRFVGFFFDTAVGAKREASSYRRISTEMRVRPEELLFVSDISEELAAARAAGVKPVLCVRQGNARQETEETRIRTFDEITL